MIKNLEQPVNALFVESNMYYFILNIIHNILNFFQEHEIVVHGIVAIILGCVIGYEREKADKPAGLRTIVLVVLGAAIFTSISQILGQNFGRWGWDGSRVASNVVVGIGFLGAGVIIFTKQRVIGLTTAASLWVAAAIGMLIGINHYTDATIITIFVYFILGGLTRIERKVNAKLHN